MLPTRAKIFCQRTSERRLKSRAGRPAEGSSTLASSMSRPPQTPMAASPPGARTRDFFDAALSIDSYHYWGCNDAQLDYVTSFVRPGGVVGIVVPGDSEDSNPEGTFHSAAWWRRLWTQNAAATVERAEMLEDGWDLWWQFCEASSAWSGKPVSEQGDAALLQDNASLGFTKIVARRLESSS